MGIMGCYLDERAIENELGGKWELVVDETYDEPTAEGFQWVNENFNGVMIELSNVANLPMTISINNMEIYKINNVAIGDGKKRWFWFRVKNGMLVNSFTGPITVDSQSSTVTESIFSRSYIPTDSIVNFDLAFNTTTATGLLDKYIKIYVLRGV